MRLIDSPVSRPSVVAALLLWLPAAGLADSIAGLAPVPNATPGSSATILGDDPAGRAAMPADRDVADPLAPASFTTGLAPMSGSSPGHQPEAALFTFACGCGSCRLKGAQAVPPPSLPGGASLGDSSPSLARAAANATSGSPRAELIEGIDPSSMSPIPAPEPGTLSILILALLGHAWRRGRFGLRCISKG